MTKLYRFCAALAALFLLTSFTVAGSDTVTVGENETLNYYCKRNRDHATPTLDPKFGFMKDYGGYYVGREDDKVIYLTFDAGYENGNIERILDTLKSHGATGAFFVLDNLIRRNTALVKRMADDGHLVCNHTAHHKDMTKISEKAMFEKELSELSSFYTEMTGKTMAMYYRPPEGKFSLNNLKFANELGYKTVFWSFAYADWDNNKQPDPEKAKKLILDNTHNGMVVLLHPTSKTNADILDSVMTEWEKMGYRFGTLDELCG